MEKKIAVVALIYKDDDFDDSILAVSRKDDHTDFGLPGGKIEDGDETIFHGLVREVKEETGLIIKRGEPIFTREDLEYITIVFLVTDAMWDIDHVLDPSETGIVKWTDFETIKKGSFGKYNAKLEEHLERLKNIFSNDK
jgi:8-oxo-dGTP pyrophosphatase MutT (NUDIX family)